MRRTLPRAHRGRRARLEEAPVDRAGREINVALDQLEAVALGQHLALPYRLGHVSLLAYGNIGASWRRRATGHSALGRPSTSRCPIRSESVPAASSAWRRACQAAIAAAASGCVSVAARASPSMMVASMSRAAPPISQSLGAVDTA